MTARDIECIMSFVLQSGSEKVVHAQDRLSVVGREIGREIDFADVLLHRMWQISAAYCHDNDVLTVTDFYFGHCPDRSDEHKLNVSDVGIAVAITAYTSLHCKMLIFSVGSSNMFDKMCFSVLCGISHVFTVDKYTVV